MEKKLHWLLFMEKIESNFYLISWEKVKKNILEKMVLKIKKKLN